MDQQSSENESRDTTSGDENTPDTHHRNADSPEPFSLVATAKYGVSRYREFQEFTANSGIAVTFIWSTVRIIVGVIAVGLLLFAVTGLATPFMSVASDSMDPNIKTGDLVVLTATDTHTHEAAHADTGVVTVETVANTEVEYQSLGGPGDVIVFNSGVTDGVPVIHRAHMWVDEGENWVAGADPSYLNESESCQDVELCPAPNAGFITAGDNTGKYDQLNPEFKPVHPDNVLAVAEFRVPWLGWFRIGIEVLLF